MSSTLHPHLKRGLAFDDYKVHQDDIVEHISPKHINPEEQEAKRRRIENIATQCLQGRLPVMLSAGLRGPFNDGWKNPWAKSKPKKAKRRSSERGSNKTSGVVRKDAARRAEPKDVRRRTRSGSRRTLEAPPIASPEASRAVERGLEDFHESHTLEDVEVPPATAPSPNEHDTSGATEFFSLNTERCVRSRSPLTNPFWLRRPESAEKFNMKRSANDIIDVSPTRRRSALERPATKKAIKLAAPKAPLGVGAPPARAPSPDDVRSSASAPMVISSPVKQTPLGPTGILHSIVQVKQTPAVAPPSEVQPAQVQSAALPQMETPATSHSNPHAKPPPLPPASIRTADHRESMSQPISQTRPTREEIQHSAERLVNSQPKPSSSASQRRHWNHINQQAEGGPRAPQHGFIASPAPNSSTGFVYKKVGGTKWTIGNAPRSKPRAVNFNSSPATKGVATTGKPGSQNGGDMAEVDVPEADLVTALGPLQSGEEAEVSQGNAISQEQQSLRSSYSSRQSAMSTQAAMLLAQLEFQESTFPTSSSRSQRPWSQSQKATPQGIMSELSPAMTPLSVFRPQLEQLHPLASAVRGPPMSTQDLFAAASPFSFSTVKKRHEHNAVVHLLKGAVAGGERPRSAAIGDKALHDRELAYLPAEGPRPRFSCVTNNADGAIYCSWMPPGWSWFQSLDTGR
ncbi:hypothetical protein CC86DRAFT_450955 [Ophiobolus disseminans]|uniref:Uncharacterized protein n=1 Tax=Ophiobolus disseminans TaxID=1469910 RepID=A0A6A7AIN5_9PLEO|nr:hypothetical protein CC86DRAFT_450955 [Ophiobolus disseminans]